ncbi:hypothetical protein NN561_019428 [Cricetulus griseus]
MGSGSRAPGECDPRSPSLHACGCSHAGAAAPEPTEHRRDESHTDLLTATPLRWGGLLPGASPRVTVVFGVGVGAWFLRPSLVSPRFFPGPDVSPSKTPSPSNLIDSGARFSTWLLSSLCLQCRLRAGPH